MLVGHQGVFFREVSIDLFLQQKAAAKLILSLLHLTEALRSSLSHNWTFFFFSTEPLADRQVS